jgi:glycosyltransferase involved in cell wall biosynthesis
MTSNLSVVIPTCNRPAGLMRALLSVYRQTLPPREIIVVDDASVPAVGDEVFSQCPATIKPILLRSPQASGAPAARNLGIRSASAEYVALLDDDDEFAPEKVQMLSAAANGGAHVLYHAALITYDDEGFSYASNPAEQVTFHGLLLRNQIGGTSMVCVHRESFLRIGGFDEQMPALQDYEAWLRCAKRGLVFQHVPGALTIYHHVTSAASISKSLDKVDRALARISELYRADYAGLGRAQLRQRDERIAIQRMQRMLLNDERWRAAGYCLRSSLRLRSVKLMLGVVPALAGLKTTMKIKNAVGL